jgi:prepilin-type N-terminal cleavage/methylation domain-containing protein
MKKGFTLIELLVTVGIISIVSVVSLLGLGSYNARKNIERALDEMKAAVKNTHSRSVVQENGKTWGIRFANPATSSDIYQVFSGLSFSTSAVNRFGSFRNGVFLSNPAVSSTIDVIFTAVTGKPNNSQVISLVNGRKDGVVGDLIMNDSSGLVDYRLDNGLVGYWHFDENTSTTAYDASGSLNNGVLANSPTWQTGTSCQAGSCLGFNGVNKYVSMADNATLRVESGSFTVSVWIKPSVVQQQVILFKGDPGMCGGYILMMNRFVNDITLTKGCVADQQVSYTFQAGNWYDVVAVQPLGGNVTYYINGQPIGSYSNTSDYISSSGQSLYIGDADTYFANKFNGVIDEVRIYNRVLSAQEILSQYNDLK